MLDRALLRVAGEVRCYLRAAAWPAIGSCELCDDETPPDRTAGKPAGNQPDKPAGKPAGNQPATQAGNQPATQAGNQAMRRPPPTRLKS